MTKKTGTLCTTLAVVLMSSLYAPSTAAPGARMVSGDQGLQNITRLMTDVSWYTSMDYVKKKAQQEDKPIFWVHMLGPMNGET